MNKFCIYGPNKLIGNIKVSGSKNSVLPILLLSIFSNEKIILKNVPKLIDVDIIINILINLGSDIEFNNSLCIIKNKYINNNIICNLAKNIRASIWIIAPLLFRFKYIKTFIPGGCSIGARPIDFHVDVLKKMGASINIENEYITAYLKDRFIGSIIKFNKKSVGATITAISAAILAKGVTIIKNSSKEPEIIDVSNFLNLLGAKISGAGTNKIKVIGVNKLYGGIFNIPSDRIEASTFLIAALISRGNITCENVQSNRLKLVLKKLMQTGASIKIGHNWINLNMENRRPKSVSIYTAPYPGFPTDLQAPFCVLNSIGIGNSYIIENIFENRFTHIPYLISMGANILLNNNKATFCGVSNLFGSNIKATDLRSSVSLVLAGCIAVGKTIIENINYIHRGYENIVYKFKSIGLNIYEI